jgi:hypothetical protein
MEEGWVLIHWSNANFSELTSTEVHNFLQAGPRLQVGASFYLYKKQECVPDGIPAQLRMMGLGGANRYVVGPEIGNQLRAYYKPKSAGGDEVEVTVILGCGGRIMFNSQRQATGTATTSTQPKAKKSCTLF